MPKVFLVNKGTHDYIKAEKYGELTTLSSGPINIFKISAMHRAFSAALENSSPDDYILVSGPSVMNVIACSMFASKHNKLNLILWKTNDVQDGDYLCRRIVL